MTPLINVEQTRNTARHSAGGALAGSNGFDTTATAPSTLTIVGPNLIHLVHQNPPSKSARPNFQRSFASLSGFAQLPVSVTLCRRPSSVRARVRNHGGPWRRLQRQTNSQACECSKAGPRADVWGPKGHHCVPRCRGHSPLSLILSPRVVHDGDHGLAKTRFFRYFGNRSTPPHLFRSSRRLRDDTIKN